MKLANHFGIEERRIISACLEIFTDDKYIHEMDVRIITGYKVEEYVDTYNKIKNDIDLNKEDALRIRQSVFHVASFPINNDEDASEKLGVDFLHVYWFSYYIRSIFEEDVVDGDIFV